LSSHWFLRDIEKADRAAYAALERDFFEGPTKCPRCSQPAYSECDTCPGGGFRCESEHCVGAVHAELEVRARADRYA
jgi:hypothetical protein